MANRKISQAGLDLIKQFEGCRLTAYQCSAGVWTIGYGHTAGVRKGMKITQAQADAYLKQDVAKFEKYVNNASYVPFTDKLNQNQFDALVSFVFNLGQGNLMKLCKGRTINQVPAVMQQYCKANGKTLPGLQRRRKAEAALYNKKVQSSTGTTTKQTYEAGKWYTVLEEIPVRNGYYGQPGKYQYLSEALKSICNSRDGIGYVKVGKIICPTEVKTFDDGLSGSSWMRRSHAWLWEWMEKLILYSQYKNVSVQFRVAFRVASCCTSRTFMVEDCVVSTNEKC